VFLTRECIEVQQHSTLPAEATITRQETSLEHVTPSTADEYKLPKNSTKIVSSQTKTENIAIYLVIGIFGAFLSIIIVGVLRKKIGQGSRVRRRSLFERIKQAMCRLRPSDNAELGG